MAHTQSEIVSSLTLSAGDLENLYVQMQYFGITPEAAVWALIEHRAKRIDWMDMYEKWAAKQMAAETGARQLVVYTSLKRHIAEFPFSSLAKEHKI